LAAKTVWFPPALGRVPLRAFDTRVAAELEGKIELACAPPALGAGVPTAMLVLVMCGCTAGLGIGSALLPTFADDVRAVADADTLEIGIVLLPTTDEPPKCADALLAFADELGATLEKAVSFIGTVVALNSVTSPCAFGWANHHSVVTPTGNVYVACIPRNSIVAVTSTGFHVVDALSSQLSTTMEYLLKSVELIRLVEYAATRSAHARLPCTDTPMRLPHGPPASFGMIALDACAIA